MCHGMGLTASAVGERMAFLPAELHVRLHNAPTNAPTLAPHSRTYSCTDAPTNVTAELFLGS